MDNTPNLGKTPAENEQRDAIHVAVVPVFAAEKLLPGDHVGLTIDGKVSEDAKPHIGIVDPFRTTGVRAGERVWMCLYPKTITSLRHDWTHPAFEKLTIVRVDHEQWLRQFARDAYVEFDQLMDAADNGYEYINAENGVNLTSDFWDHWEAYRGRKAEYRTEYFSCSC